VKPFMSWKLAVGLVLVSALSLIAFAALSAYAPFLRSDQSGGNDALSKSAVGFAGILYLADETGIPTTLGRVPPSPNRYSLTVLTPELGNSADQIGALSHLGATLIVLPKWLASSDPEHSGWVTKLGLQPAKLTEALLTDMVKNAKIAQGKGTKPVHLRAVLGSFASAVPRGPVTIDSIQTISADVLDPVIADDQGHAVLAVVRGTKIYILAEPDLLDNVGIHDASVARMALGMISALRDNPREISFDVTLNGFRGGPDLLFAMFSPPFLGATLCALLAAAFIGFHAFHRFGAAKEPGRAIAFGKRALADNTAAVIRLMRREPRMAPRYALATLNAAASQLGVARERDQSWIAALERRRGVRDRFTQLDVEAQNVRDNGGLMRVAAKLYKWRRGILNERS